MAALYTVSDGDPADAADLNQLISTFSNVLGVTDTAQLALGRLVLPRSLVAAAPGSPITGQMWMTTDEGASGGRLYMKHTTDIVPYLPLRQIQISSKLSSAAITSTSFVDTGLTLSIITTGGRLKIYIVPSDSSEDSVFRISRVSGVGLSTNSQLRAVVGAQNLGECIFGAQVDNDVLINLDIPPSSLVWLYKPAPGSYTVKIQALVNSSCELDIDNLYLIVEEYGD